MSLLALYLIMPTSANAQTQTKKDEIDNQIILCIKISGEGYKIKKPKFQFKSVNRFRKEKFDR